MTNSKQSLIELVLQVAGQGAVEGLSRSTAELRQRIADAAKAMADSDGNGARFEETIRRVGTQLERETRLLEQLKAAQAAATNEAYQLADADDELALATDHVDAAMDRLVADAVEATRAQKVMRQIVDELADSQRAATATTVAFAGAKGRAGQSTRDVNMLTLEAGRIFQDVYQGGLGGGLNNIERVTASLGLGGGMAGALTTLGVLLFAFQDQIKDSAKALGLFASEAEDRSLPILDRLQARIKELEDKKVKLSVDSAELDAAKEKADAIKAGLQAFEDFRKKTSTPEQESGKAVQDLVANAPGGAQSVADALKQSLVREFTAKNQVLNETAGPLDDARRMLNNPNSLVNQIGNQDQRNLARQGIERQIASIEEQRRAARAAINQEAEARAGSLLAGGAGGTEQGVNALAGALGAAGRGDLAGQIAENGPQALAARKREEAIDRATEQFIEFVDKEIEARRNLTETLNEQGRENQRQAEKDRDRQSKQKDQEAKDSAEFGQKWDAMVAAEMARMNDQTTGVIGATTAIDEQAAAAAAQARAQGGYTDPRTGRFVRATPEQQQAALAQDAARMAARARPDIIGSPEEAMAVGQRIAQDAFAKVDEMTAQNAASLRLQNQGLDATQATQMAAMQTLQAVQAMAQRVQQLEANAQALGREAQATRRDVVGRRPPFQPQVPAR